MAYPFSPPQVQFGLANQANQFMTQQAQLPFLRGLPGYSSMLGQRSANTGSLLRGEVPQDVLQQLQQRGAERGVAMGSPGSPNANASWLRALGLTSLGLQQQGSQQLTQGIADVPVPALWNPLELYTAQLKAQQELEQAKGGESGNATGWLTQSQQPWFVQQRYTAPSGAMF